VPVRAEDEGRHMFRLFHGQSSDYQALLVEEDIVEYPIKFNVDMSQLSLRDHSLGKN
jgi:hypothetical protein